MPASVAPADPVQRRLSVVIPTLDEGGTLTALLDGLQRQRGVDLECIVADGGSRDATTALAQQHGARIVSSPRGRGAQMNAGAAAASGEWLLFLHADSGLPSEQLLSDALAAITAQAAAGEIIAGHFRLQFLRGQPGHDALFRFLEAKTVSNRPYTVNGDQGLLIRAADFQALGGFDTSLPFFEDQRLAARVFERGRFVLLPGFLETSARRFEHEGHLPRYLLMGLMMCAESAELRDFLAETRNLYATQKDTRALDTRPFARQLLAHIGRRSPADRLRAYLRAGRLLRDSLWQLALLADIRSSAENGGAWLRRYDRFVAPLLHHAMTDAALAAALAVALRALPYAHLDK